MLGMITPIELIEWFMKDCNQKFASKLDQIQMEDMDLSERVAIGIQTRLEYIIPVLSTWHQAMALGAIYNSVTTAHQLEEIVNLIAKKSGPLSSQLERTAIGGLYVATELNLLADTSPHHQDTWDFLKSRVQDLHQLQQNQHKPLSTDSMIASAAVISSLAGGLLSLAPPAVARGVMMNPFVPQLLTMITPVRWSKPVDGSLPQHYSDLPPFPSDATPK